MGSLGSGNNIIYTSTDRTLDNVDKDTRDRIEKYLGKATNPRTMEQALKDTNPNYTEGKNGKWENNCQRCVLAYELQRRGYNVTAKPYPGPGDKLARGGWKKVFKNARTLNVKNSNDIENKMKKYGDGARAIVSCEWNTGGGHVFIAENVGGRVRYIDPQTHRSYANNYFSYIKKGSLGLTRVDNAQPNKYLNRIVNKVGE